MYMCMFLCLCPSLRTQGIPLQRETLQINPNTVKTCSCYVIMITMVLPCSCRGFSMPCFGRLSGSGVVGVSVSMSVSMSASVPFSRGSSVTNGHFTQPTAIITFTTCECTAIVRTTNFRITVAPQIQNMCFSKQRVVHLQLGIGTSEKGSAKARVSRHSP